VVVFLFFAVELLLGFFHVKPLSNHEDPFVGFESTLPLYVADSPDEVDSDSGENRTTAKNRLRYFNRQSFSTPKAPGTYRIFCLGGSTTYGRPYDDVTSFPGWLRKLLPLADDQRDYEVINAGGVSYASYRVAQLMDELCTYEPDLFIVYTGHNEFLEERTYRELKKNRIVPAKLQWALGHSRSYSSLRSLYTRFRGEPPVDSRSILPSEVNTLLDRSVGPESYHRGSLQHSAVVGHLAFNLARIIESSRRIDADVIMVTPACNLKDFSPFKSERTASALNAPPETQDKWRSAFAKGMSLRETGDLAAAAESLREAIDIDDSHAVLNYELGVTLTALERWDDASKYLQRAVDEDICPLRATTAIQRVIEETAILRKVPLVDFVAILRAENQNQLGHELLGREWFLDHVHPTTTANRLLAFSLIDVLQRNGTLPTKHALWNHDHIVEVVQEVEGSLDTAQHATALRNLSQVLGWAGKHAEAGPLAVRAGEMREAAGIDDDPEVLFYAANHYTKTGKDAKAVALLQRLVDLKPKFREARRRLATLQFTAGNYAEAVEHLRPVNRQIELNVSERRQFAFSLVELGEFREAIDVLLAIQPNERDHDCYLCLAHAHAGQGEVSKAELAYRRAIDEKPNSIVARLHLARLYRSGNQPDKAKILFKEILELEPGMADVQRELEGIE